MTAAFVHPRTEHLLRDLAPRVLGAVARRHDDFAAAEDAVQEALLAAATAWPRDGLPKNPAGWLYRVALRRLADHLRAEAARQRREESVGNELWAEWAFVPAPDAEVCIEEDDALTLLFMCCHPSVTPASAIALTLRAVGGLTTAEIARAFLVPEATMAQRISRAKQSIRASGIPFALPTDAERDDRLSSVLHVLYLVFNEGYVASAGGSLQRVDLSTEAMRLARMVHALLPASGEVAGLLALMLLTDARRGARTGEQGEVIPLDEQDRALWDRAKIAEGTALVGAALSTRPVGAYQLLAAVAALHDEAVSFAETDWPQILALYEILMRAAPDNPLIGLNRAVAVAMVHGPAAGLALVDTLEDDPRVAGHHRVAAVRAHMYEMAGNLHEAVGRYRLAAEGTLSVPERDYLLLRAARVAFGMHGQRGESRRSLQD